MDMQYIKQITGAAGGMTINVDSKMMLSKIKHILVDTTVP